MIRIGKEFELELTIEAEVTRRFLASVPFDKSEFQPTEKSEKLGRLAIHIAEIIAWWKEVIENSKLDFIDFKPKEIKNTNELLSYFDNLLMDAKKALHKVTNEELNNDWSMTNGAETYFNLPKKQVLRIFCMNHLIHHRSQLGVYLRMLDIPVPATYGPSADDFEVILANKFMQ